MNKTYFEKEFSSIESILNKNIYIFLIILALDHVDQFHELCYSMKLFLLKHFYFSFRFPEEIENVWHSNLFINNNKWPFDNIGYFKDESFVFTGHGIRYIQKVFFIIYKHPIDILLKYKRTLHNHCFATHTSHSNMKNQSNSIQWTCNRIDQSDQILKTLKTIATGHVKSLSIKYVGQSVSINI
jgi:hypothetical protein